MNYMGVKPSRILRKQNTGPYARLASMAVPRQFFHLESQTARLFAYDVPKY